MKFFKHDKKYLYWGITAVAVIIVSIICNNILTKWDETMSFATFIFNAIEPIVFGIIFAYVLNPLLNLYEKYVFLRLFNTLFKKNSERTAKAARMVSIFVTLLTAVAIVAGLITMIVPELYVNIEKLVKNLPTYIENGQSWLTQLKDDYPEVVEQLTASLDAVSDDLIAFLTDKFIPNANNIITQISIGIYGTLKTMLNIIVGIIVSVYILSSKEHYAALSKKLVYGFAKKDHAEKIIKLVKYTDDRFGGFLVGKIVDSTIIGIICFIMCSIFRMPYALLVSAIVGVTNIIPFFGPFIGAVPCAILILLVNPIKAVTFAVLIIIIQQADGNIIGPKILGDRTGLDSFGVMFAILFSGGLFGITGLIIGVPMFAVIFGIIYSICDKNLEERKMPTDIEAYYEDDVLVKAVPETVTKDEKSE